MRLRSAHMVAAVCCGALVGEPLAARASGSEPLATASVTLAGLALPPPSAMLLAALALLTLAAFAARAMLVRYRRRAAVHAGQAEPSSDVEQLIMASPDVFLVVDDAGLIIRASAAAPALLGVDPVGKALAHFVPSLKEQDERARAAKVGKPVETELLRESTDRVAVEILVNAARRGERALTLLRVTDITARRGYIGELERLALHDTLTRLPNRGLLHDRLESAVALAERRAETFVVMLLDLNKFKQVNDTFGHPIGDLLLRQVAPRLAAPLRKSDTLARIGGDEFAVLLPPPTEVSHACRVAERIVESLSEPFLIEGMRLEIGVSIGVVLYPDHGSGEEELLQRADEAMYAAKRGKLGFVVYGDNPEPCGRQALDLQRALRVALERDELFLLYQPKLKADDKTFTGAEVLLRWQHPLRGTLTPGDFLPVAERSGMIDEISLWTLNACLRDQYRWRQAGMQVPLCVNLAGSSPQQPQFPQILRVILSHWDADPASLTLEINESAVMSEPDSMMAQLDAIVELGCSIALDDFGRGYSSLVHLQRLPVKELKIHRAFIGALEEDEDRSVIVRSIIKLAHALHLQVVANGVESERQIALLQLMGCDQLQGYALASPMTVDQFSPYIETRVGKKAEPPPSERKAALHARAVRRGSPVG